jgi:hypothetical protein
MNLTTHLCLVSRSGMVDLYFHSPISLHGMVHNYLSTGETLLFCLYNVQFRVATDLLVI